MEALARAGLVAKGISYGLVGALAVGVAVGVGGATTSREGALHRLAGSGFGKILLALLALGLAAYALWRFLEALLGDEWLKRVGYAGRGAIYAGLEFSAATILVGSGSHGSQSQKAHKATAVVLQWPAGTWLVGAAGVVAIGAGAWNLY